MLKLKKTAVAVLALGSSAVFAGTMGPVCVPGNVTIPCEKTAWDFGARALYLQSTFSDDLEYSSVVTTPTVGSEVQNLGNVWGWGFMVEGSYHFNTGNDLNLNWYHLHNGNSGSFVTPGVLSSGIVGADFNFGPQWDAVNFEVGQHIDFSDMKSIRLHAGVEYARIKRQIQLSSLADGGATAEVSTDSATYNGFGPRVGADSRYDFGNGLGIYANAAGSLLIGTGKQSVSGYVDSVVTGGTTFSMLNVSSSKTLMVPELEAKLGLMYDYSMAQGDLGLDVGYMWVNYFNAATRSAVIPATGTGFFRSADYGLDGVYFGFKWVGNV